MGEGKRCSWNSSETEDRTESYEAFKVNLTVAACNDIFFIWSAIPKIIICFHHEGDLLNDGYQEFK